MKNKGMLLAVKYALMVLFLILLYAVQTTLPLFGGRGVYPVLLVAAAVAIAMTEGEFAGGLFGALCGLLCDLGGQSLFGFNGLMLLLCGAGVGLLTLYLVRPSWRSSLLFTAAAALFRGGVGFFFAYGIWGYENAHLIFIRETLPVALCTAVTAPVFFWLARWYRRRFELLLEKVQG